MSPLAWFLVALVLLGALPQVSGFYQFLLNATAPSGTYTLAVTTFPPDYIAQPSALIPVCTNTATVAETPRQCRLPNL